MKTTRTGPLTTQSTPLQRPQDAAVATPQAPSGAASETTAATQMAQDAFTADGDLAPGTAQPIPSGGDTKVADVALKTPLGAADAATLTHILGPELAATTAGATSIADALQRVPNTALANLITERFTALEREVMGAEPPRLSVGDQFVDIGRLVPGQTRISLQRVREKVAKQVQYDGFFTGDGDAKPAFADGEATVPLSVVKTAVAAPGGRVLVTDGNHQTVASILAGASKVPMRIVADHQDMSKEAFAALAEQEGWLYLNDFGGAAPAVEASYKSLKDDPVRFLFTQVALKASRSEEGIAFEDDTRPQDRVWMKLDGITVDFVEFKLADVIYRAAEQDPFLAEVLETGTLAEKAKATRKALGAAADAGTFDAAAMGIVLLDGERGIAPLKEKAAQAFAAHA